MPRVLLHVVDDSGSWGTGGVFTALSKLSDAIGAAYEQAGEMDDLHLGDAHVIPLEQHTDSDADDSGGGECQMYVALCVAQTRSSKGDVGGIRVDDLTRALKRVACFCKDHSAAVHLPRIGFGTRGFNWYAIERTLRTQFVHQGIPATVYYFSRRLADVLAYFFIYINIYMYNKIKNKIKTQITTYDNDFRVFFVVGFGQNVCGIKRWSSAALK